MRALSEWIYNYRAHLIVTVLISLFLFVFLAPQMLVIIGPGELGVLYRLFQGGTVTDHIFPEGFYIILPWNRIYIYNVRVQETKRALDVLTADGLIVHLELSIRYHPEIFMLGVLHQTVGPNYLEQVVVPEVEGVVRTAVGQLNVEELYSGRTDVQELAGTETAAAPPVPARPTGLGEVISRVVHQVSERFVLIDDVVLTKVTIPELVQTAIQEKIKQKELAHAQQYRLQQARIEVQIKQFEANANTILSSSLSAEILKWKGIEATRELATSANSKIIVIGAGPGGLPIILGLDK